MEELVSIIMPSYNTAKYISQAIRSVMSQTYTNWELIIVDDGSTDNTDDVVAEFLSDARIKYLKNDQNQGAAVSRNRALREAKGKWIAFLDSDDLWKPKKLQNQIAFMENNGYHFSYTNYIETDEAGVPNGRWITGPAHITKRKMYDYCWMGCLTVMYDAQEIGLIQIVDIKKNNDYAMWLKVCHKADCYLLDQTLSSYRKRESSISNQGYIKLIKWHYKLFNQAENKGALVSWVYTFRNLFWGLYKKAKYCSNQEKYRNY